MCCRDISFCVVGCIVLFHFILIWVDFDPVRKSTPMGKHCLFLWPKGDKAAACEESAVGHQMGSGCTVCSARGRGRRWFWGVFDTQETC